MESIGLVFEDLGKVPIFFFCLSFICHMLICLQDLLFGMADGQKCEISVVLSAIIFVITNVFSKTEDFADKITHWTKMCFWTFETKEKETVAFTFSCGRKKSYLTSESL